MGSVRHEIKQTRPFASLADEAVVTLLRTADHARTALSSVVEEAGITLQQYNVLRILRGAGASGLPTLEIASRMIEASPGITRLLDRLEAKGLALRERCPADHRQVLCRASERALQGLSALERPMAEASERLMSALDARRSSELVRLLDAVRAAGTAPGRAAERRESNSKPRGRKEKRR
ncbi:MAG: MarR family winged helix-turn-helix transcriptional regulator [Betaproteobacteria bacterium]